MRIAWAGKQSEYATRNTEYLSAESSGSRWSAVRGPPSSNTSTGNPPPTPMPVRSEPTARCRSPRKSLPKRPPNARIARTSDGGTRCAGSVPNVQGCMCSKAAPTLSSRLPAKSTPTAGSPTPSRRQCLWSTASLASSPSPAAWTRSWRPSRREALQRPHSLRRTTHCGTWSRRNRAPQMAQQDHRPGFGWTLLSRRQGGVHRRWGLLPGRNDRRSAQLGIWTQSSAHCHARSIRN